ncbi:CRISPR-associated protein Cas5 [Streptomyces mirabilis]|uniref:CRISPR-associated protein Cas5 n=1 Tax=Streptomyces mirabilis TaxID=68239 RepID=UPI0036C9B703
MRFSWGSPRSRRSRVCWSRVPSRTAVRGAFGAACAEAEGTTTAAKVATAARRTARRGLALIKPPTMNVNAVHE